MTNNQRDALHHVCVWHFSDAPGRPDHVLRPDQPIDETKALGRMFRRRTSPVTAAFLRGVASGRYRSSRGRLYIWKHLCPSPSGSAFCQLPDRQPSQSINSFEPILSLGTIENAPCEAYRAISYVKDEVIFAAPEPRFGGR
jgi:hypothetical protein